MVIDRLAPNMGSGPHAVLLNNLGGAMPIEISVLAEEIARSRISDTIRWMIGPAGLMTSLDMHGFSVSLLPVADEDVAALQASRGSSSLAGVPTLRPGGSGAAA